MSGLLCIKCKLETIITRGYVSSSHISCWLNKHKVFLGLNFSLCVCLCMEKPGTLALKMFYQFTNHLLSHVPFLLLVRLRFDIEKLQFECSIYKYTYIYMDTFYYYYVSLSFPIFFISISYRPWERNWIGEDTVTNFFFYSSLNKI